jgi:hypothetical protein
VPAVIDTIWGDLMSMLSTGQMTPVAWGIVVIAVSLMVFRLLFRLGNYVAAPVGRRRFPFTR